MKSKAIFIGLVALGVLSALYAYNNIATVNKFVGPKTNA